MSAVGLQPWPFLFSSISAGAPERGAFFGAIKIEQNVNFVQSRTHYTFLKLLKVLAQYGIHA